METATKLISADDLIAMGDIGRCELIQGELIMMSPAGAWHGLVAMRIGRYLAAFADEHDLGATFAAETGFKIESDPDTVRAPDVSFIRKFRLGELKRRGFFGGIPDLAVEVISFDDTKREVVDKANMWLANGTQVVWIADPLMSTLAIHRVAVPPQILKPGQSIQNEPLLPGFTLAIEDIFRAP